MPDYINLAAARDMIAARGIPCCGWPRTLPSDFTRLRTRLRPHDQQIPFELRDGIEHLHSHRAGRARR